MTDRATQVLRRLVPSVYLPTTAGTMGVTMLIPVLPLYVTDVGLSLSTGSVVLAGVGMGAAIGGLPAGALVERLGERTLLVAALCVTALSTALLGTTTTAIALVALRLSTGAAGIAMRLSRQTYITRRVATEIRGRAMSVMGGSFRVAALIGPILGGASTDRFGYATTFAIAGGLTSLGLIPALLAPEHEPHVRLDAPRRSGLMRAVRNQWRALLKGGFAPMLIMTVREGRYVVLPLIGDELGLNATEVGLLITVGTAADLLLFPVSGVVMDRFGRLAGMVPAFGLIGAGLVIVGIADTATLVVVGGAVIGVGNGLSAGSMLTLASDLAPKAEPGPFLAGMAVLQDGGRILGPLVVGIVGSRFDLGVSALTLAVIITAAICWLVFVVGETSKLDT